jgi:hypothetical protein
MYGCSEVAQQPPFLFAGQQRAECPAAGNASDCAATPSFWGYVLARGLSSLVCRWLQHSQLPLLFDLDETLVVANVLGLARHQCESCEAAM